MNIADYSTNNKRERERYRDTYYIYIVRVSGKIKYILENIMALINLFDRKKEIRECEKCGLKTSYLEKGVCKLCLEPYDPENYITRIEMLKKK